MSGSASSRLRYLGLAVSVLSVAAVVWWALHQDAPELPSDAGALAWLGVAIVGYLFGACALRAERWRLLLQRDGAEPHRSDVYALTAVGFMGNNVLPARAGDALRVVLLAPRANTSKRSVLGTLIAERVLDVAVLLGLFVIVAFGLLDGAELPSTGRLVTGAAVLAVVALVGAAVALRLHRQGKLHLVAPLARATAQLRGRHGAEALATTIALWAAEIAVWWAVAEAAGLDLSALEACYLISLASIFVLIPAGPGYAGTLDAAIVLGVSAVGHTESEALAYLLLLRLVLLLPITIAGLVALVARYGGRTALST